MGTCLVVDFFAAVIVLLLSLGSVKKNEIYLKYFADKN